MCKPHSLLATLIAPTTTVSRRAVGDFYIRAERALLPPHAPNMLAEQYCSLNNPDLLGVVNSAGALRLAWTQRVSAHFALHAARVEAIATGGDAFLEDLPEYE